MGRKGGWLFSLPHKRRTFLQIGEPTDNGGEPGKTRVTNEEFNRDCLVCSITKRWIPGLASRYTKLIEDKDDYKQEALLCIAAMPGCPGTDACRDLTFKMVRSAYRKYFKTYREQNTLNLNAVYHRPGEQWRELWKEIEPGHPEYGRMKKPAISPDEIPHRDYRIRRDYWLDE